jgi:hypothetical protein
MSPSEHDKNHTAAEKARAERAHADQQATKGTRLANPAEPYAVTEQPPRAEAKAFMREGAEGVHPSGYPKMKYHPVHGGVEVTEPGQESALYPKTDWFDSPELADAARTHTEAEIVRIKNQLAKLETLDKLGLPVVRNSVQADESIRRSQAEPL